MIPNYEQCLEIVDKNENFCHVKFENINIFNYRLKNYSMFESPLGSESDIKAYELRGLVFIDNIHYLSINKFFNYGETIGSMPKDLDNKEILYVQEKLDGSLIRFLPINGEIIPKSMNSINSFHTELVKNLFYQNDRFIYHDFIKETLDNRLAAFFEFGTLDTMIVIPHIEPMLRLIQLRDETTGAYLDIYNNDLIKKYGVPIVSQCETKSLSYYLDKAQTEKNKEGWVITFKDGQKVKIKTVWYFNRHAAKEGLKKEHNIIRHILNEDLDDLLPLLALDDPIRTHILKIQDTITRYFGHSIKQVLTYVKEYDGKRKNLALKLQKEKNPLMGLVMNVISTIEKKDETLDTIENFITKELKVFILKACFKQQQAKKFLKGID